jgi:hypothetical protein
VNVGFTIEVFFCFKCIKPTHTHSESIVLSRAISGYGAEIGIHTNIERNAAAFRPAI